MYNKRVICGEIKMPKADKPAKKPVVLSELPDNYEKIAEEHFLAFEERNRRWF